MLHIGNNRRVARGDIVAILPIQDESAAKAAILLADGTMLRTGIGAATLKKRLAGGPLAHVSAPTKNAEKSGQKR